MTVVLFLMMGLATVMLMALFARVNQLEDKLDRLDVILAQHLDVDPGHERRMHQ